MATSKGRIIVREDPGSSSKETSHVDYHPCNYLRLAKLAFLKCLGLDFMAERSSSTSSSSEHIRKDR
uniref:Uncharacterized protein n=1 Tax=Rhizophora mucronata TaxID=61149 RepID=A0A2P2Q2N9_RHIMU